MNRVAGKSRSEFALFIAAGLALLGAGALHWWHVIGHDEPGYVKASRVLVALCGVMLVIAAFVPRMRPSSLPIAGLVALLLPLLVVQYIVTRDPLTMDYVDMQTRQADWLLESLNRTEDEPYIPWVEPDTISAVPNRSSIYNVMDGFESAPVFSGMGWFASLIFGICIFTFACLLYGPLIAAFVARRRGILVAVAVAGIVFFYGGPSIAYLCWNRARAAGAAGDYASAVYYDRLVAKFDPRWSYDTLFQYETGRFYGHLGLTQEPDYWLFVADTLVSSGHYQQAVDVYVDRLGGETLSRTGTTRYVHALILTGAVNFRQARYAQAADLWRQAVSKDPDDVEALYFYAFGLTKLGRYSEAVPVWKSLIAKNESVGLYRYKYFANRKYRKQISSRSWNMLAWCYFQLHDYDSAMHCRFNSMQAGKTDVTSLPDADPDGDEGGQ